MASVSGISFDSFFFRFVIGFFGAFFVLRLIAFDLVLVTYKVHRFRVKIDVR